MEEKERYEVILPSLNGYAYIHDFKTDNVLNTYDSCDLLNQQDKENQQLKQQLEEKEQENERLKEEICKYEITLIDKNSQLKKQQQDKISFAVEQLTQAKEYINKSLEYMWNNNAEMTCRDRNIIDGIYNKIDNQIEQLKGER